MEAADEKIRSTQELPVPDSSTAASGTPDNFNVNGTPESRKSANLPDSSGTSGNSGKQVSYTASKLSAAPKTSDSDKNKSADACLKIDFSDNGLVQGFIMSEILARPKAMKRRGNTIWNSRF
ncbi:hypothetical protein [Clostridium sp. BNL1100]|uniref:hypothetical protein n=1 Tax=Clostridium sp. BNL1100 TaxID=755731 RepID=UPI00024A73EA|nr:hypothetical protein [Clostridium sp. BNL1100]AEY66827.1 hypothetical protein Clo1100_2665 [Clostridium sp. BNL1100]